MENEALHKRLINLLESDDDYRNKFESLTEREKLYFSIMYARSGVLYITSKPGIAKSAMSRSIANKMGFDYIDIRLSQVDEIDVGLYPHLSEEAESSTKIVDYAVPAWAAQANKRPTIIHFEELNRANLHVRNAALQILNERQIGYNFFFNDNVLMMSSGNLGDEDGTDVEDFDAALNNRLIHFPHSLGVDEWINNYAKQNVHEVIVNYIGAHKEQLYVDPSDNIKSYATPRSWTFLSDFIISSYGKESLSKNFIPTLTQVAPFYIGNAAQGFIRYCEDSLVVNINDILDRYPQVKADLKKMNRDKSSELIHSLKQIDVKELTENQRTNAVNFLLENVAEDELSAYVFETVKKEDTNNDIIKEYLLHFADILKSIQRINKPKK
jgi:hypothetical protein